MDLSSFHVTVFSQALNISQTHLHHCFMKTAIWKTDKAELARAFENKVSHDDHVATSAAINVYIRDAMAELQ